MNTTKKDAIKKLKDDVIYYVRNVIEVDHLGFAETIYNDRIKKSVFAGFDLTKDSSGGIRNFHAEYIKNVSEEDYKNFLPRLTIFKPRHYPTMKGFVKRLETILQAKSE
jgi:hypothetical protein